VLHLAASARTCVQTEMGAMRLNALGGLFEHLGQRGLLPVVFFAMHIGTHHLKRQCAIDKHHLAIVAMGYALGIQIHGLDA
jgi:Na+/H+-dicarboxylate symporter